MTRRLPSPPARLAAVGAIGAVAAVVMLSSCGSDSAAPPTSYGRATTTFTTEPVRTTTPATTTIAADPNATSPEGGTADPGVPEGITVDPATGQWTYELARGDNPGRLAERFGTTPEALAEANAGVDGYASYLIGTVIVVPNAPAGGEVTVPTDEATTPETTGSSTAPVAQCADGAEAETYEIASGDNPGRLAERFDVTVEELNEANAGVQGYDSYLIGTEIVIPC